MADRIAVWLPLPAKELSPNARCHWRVKANATKDARMLAKLQTMSGIGTAPRWPSAFVRCSFTFRCKRRRDKDNLLASMKAYFDGLADAGVVENDSQLTYEPVLITAPNSKQPGVLVEVFKAT